LVRREAAHFRRALELLRPGGVLAMSNWFLLVQSIADEPNMDWSEFAGPALARERAVVRPRTGIGTRSRSSG